MLRMIAIGGVVALALGNGLDAPHRPLVIGHRGASGYRPEHTIESYRLAIEQGADVIEPDLVITKDGVLVARHENEIGTTTDVADRFPDRKTTHRIDGRDISGWFTEDLTLAELKTLRARERLSFRSHEFDGRFDVPTFDEVVRFAAEQGRQTGRTIAIYPETKHPTYFRSIGLALEDRLLETLNRNALTERTSAVFIQSFEASSLQYLRPRTKVRLVQLLDDGDTTADMKAIAAYADGVGPNKRLIVPAAADGALMPPTDLVARAHAAGLFVHVWTMRSDPVFLSKTYEGHPEREYQQFASLGVDGVFTDFPDAAVRAFGKQ